MTPTQPIRHNIMLPQERFFQLQELSDALGGKTMSETLQALFSAARAQGLIEGHSIPGVTINALSDGLVIQFDDTEAAGFTIEGARALADTVRLFATGANDGPSIIDTDHDFTVRRKGRGVIVELGIRKDAPEKAWNFDIAAEFADLIDAAVAQKCQK
jgi:hypothetical protein